MKKIIAIASAATVLAFVLCSGNHIAHATVSSGSIACHAPSDCIVSASSFQYDVSFVTSNTNVASQINITFPNSYSFNTNAMAVTGVMLNGTSIPVGFNLTGNTVNAHLITPRSLSGGTVTLSLTNSSTTSNPSSAGSVGNFTITTDASGEVAQSNITGVVMTGITASPILSAPAVGTFADTVLPVTYTLPQASTPGTVKLTFTPTSGSTTVLTLADTSAGVPQSFTLSPKNGFAGASAVVGVAGATTVADGTYTITLSYQNAFGNPAASASVTGVILVPVTIPTLTTDGADATDATVETLHATLTSGGGEMVHTGFLYDTSPTPTTAHAFLDQIYGGSPVPFIGPAMSLSCGTKYYYQAYATNSAGTGYGSIASFTTAACAPVSLSVHSVAGGRLPFACTDPAALNYKTFYYAGTNTSCAYAVPKITDAVPTEKPVISRVQRTLMLGMQSNEVRILQAYLNAHGFAVAKKGKGSAGHEHTIFGAGTRSALMAFQKARGLKQTGVTDEATRMAMR